ncbi:CD276 antigen-like [Carettochelys insculpta]|uniref:CD276 antigen-like n=1 Tax=Carettochelys insculpta TaxID=44489 RepID=UPI003EB6F84B
MKTLLVYWLHFSVLSMGEAQLVSEVVAQFGGDVTLSCLFPSQPRMDLQRLTVTWQKELVGAQALVVHSYYYGKDQLATQNAAYRNRTQLDADGLAQGNGSLVLRAVRTQDEGVYLCHVTSALGSRAERWELRVTAPFSEPQLTVSISGTGVRLTACAGGGYPAATLYWLDEAGGNVTAEGATEQSADEQGLYHVTSWVMVPPATRRARLAFVLSPRTLGTPITRFLSVEMSPELLDSPVSCLGIRLAVLCTASLFLVLLAAAFLYYLHQRPVESNSRGMAEKEQKEALCPVPASPSSGEAGPAGNEQPGSTDAD